MQKRYLPPMLLASWMAGELNIHFGNMVEYTTKLYGKDHQKTKIAAREMHELLG
jgi:hypothetical protein